MTWRAGMKRLREYRQDAGPNQEELREPGRLSPVRDQPHRARRHTITVDRLLQLADVLREASELWAAEAA